jgi:hypothetical protein
MLTTLFSLQPWLLQQPNSTFCSCIGNSFLARSRMQLNMLEPYLQPRQLVVAVQAS